MEFFLHAVLAMGEEPLSLVGHMIAIVKAIVSVIVTHGTYDHCDVLERCDL